MECEKFVAQFASGESKNLLFSGSPGLGKTFLSGCIANEIIKQRFSVLYLPASEMLNIMSRHNFFQFSDSNNRRDEDFKYSFIFDCDLLIIDDLGTEVISESKYSSILSVLDSRFAADSSRICKTIISTNLGISDIFDRYTERVGSRIVGNFDILGFRGDDLRLKRR
jgi:DNA replication protein DnaC